MVRVMKLDRATPSELAEALDELASIGYADTFPHISQEETVEADAAAFIRAAEAFLLDVVSSGGPHAERAQSILSRLE